MASAAGWASGATPVDQAVLIARFTARVSLGLFLIVYAFAPERRQWLVAFVVAHLIHFAAMIHLVTAERLQLRWHELVFGTLAYAIPLAVAVVPGNARAGWRRFGLHYVWLSFAVTYYHRLFEFPDRRAAGAFAFALLIAALLMRVVAAIRAR